MMKEKLILVRFIHFNANWIRKRKYNIPLDYAKLYFPNEYLKNVLYQKIFLL